MTNPVVSEGIYVDKAKKRKRAKSSSTIVFEEIIIPMMMKGLLQKIKRFTCS